MQYFFYACKGIFRRISVGFTGNDDFFTGEHFQTCCNCWLATITIISIPKKDIVLQSSIPQYFPSKFRKKLVDVFSSISDLRNCFSSKLHISCPKWIFHWNHPFLIFGFLSILLC